MNLIPNFIRKAFPPVLSPVDNRGGWLSLIREPFTGAWQRNLEYRADTVLESPALFSCITLIASDVSKLKPRLMQLQDWGGWTPTTSPAYTPILRKPNNYQTHIQFKEQWLISKLSRGNVYVWKERDNRGVVVALHVLDPLRVTPLVAPDSSVYYQLNQDVLSGIGETGVTVPASEIIHDRYNCLFHPLVGLSPIFACGLPALQALNTSKHWTRFFENNAQPGGIITAPGAIGKEAAERVSQAFKDKGTGINAGSIVVMGDGLKYEAMSMNAVDAQVIQQLQWSSETIAACFHMPAYKLNVGAAPARMAVDSLATEYYTQCLQSYIESWELCMDDGLGIGDDNPLVGGKVIGVDLDLDGLLRMDKGAQITSLAAGITAAIYSPDEARAKVDMPPVDGGDTPYLQVQNYSLAALAVRDQEAIEAAKNPPVPAVAPPAPGDLPIAPPDSTPVAAPVPAPEPAAKGMTAADWMDAIAHVRDLANA